MEAEEWDVLPGETYARGFIRTYASYLGLDGDRLADEHRRDSGVVRPAERLPGAKDGAAQGAPGGRRRLPPRLVATIVSVALVAVLIAAGLFSGSGGDAPTVPPGHPAGA